MPAPASSGCTSTAIDRPSLGLLLGQDIPDVAANALVATETRPRCERIEEGRDHQPARARRRGRRHFRPARLDPDVGARRQGQLADPPSAARDRGGAGRTMKAGTIHDPGDLVAAFAREISRELDPQVAELGDELDDCESELQEPQHLPSAHDDRLDPFEAITFRRFVAPDRDALNTLSQLDFDWLAEDDRLHIREAGDRFARMAEELEAVRERSALLHEQLTDLRAEEIDQRGLLISVVAFIFLPLTFITGLLVIARSEATKQSQGCVDAELDCFASLAMTS
jgi:zinc transporter